MTARIGRISLFVTLGIAAIDMLSCSFIASILLFLMFLLPSSGAGEAATGTEKLLAFQWTIASDKAVLRIALGPSAQDIVHIWSDDPDALIRTGACATLSKNVSPASCYLYVATLPDKAEGMIVIKEPKPGKWNAEFSYADSRDHLNVMTAPAIDVDVMVIGADTIMSKVSALSPLRDFDIRTTARDQSSSSAITAALDIQ